MRPRLVLVHLCISATLLVSRVAPCWGAPRLINNGLAPPNPENVVDYTFGDRILVRDVGCGTDEDVFAECSSPGVSTILEVVDGANYSNIHPLDTSTILISGGQSGAHLRCFDSSRAIMTGGAILAMIAFENCSMDISGGSPNQIYVHDNASVSLRGNTFVNSELNLDMNARADFVSGSVSRLITNDSSRVIWTGGQVRGDLLPQRASEIEVHGLGFKLDGVPIPFGLVPGSGGMLTGTLSSGEAMSALVPARQGNVTSQVILVEATPDPAFDADLDFIQNSIDGVFSNGFADESGVFSNHFTDEHLNGTTSGVVLSRGNLLFAITDATNPQDGIRITTAGGSGNASIRVCGLILRVTPGSDVTLTCGSLWARVDAGSVTVVLDDGVGTTVAVGSGASVKFDRAIVPISVTNVGSMRSRLTLDSDVTSPDTVWLDPSATVRVGNTRCPPFKRTACTTLEGARGSLTIDESRLGNERLHLMIPTDTTLTAAELGNPLVEDGNRYSACIYRDSGLVLGITVDRAGQSCGERLCWSALDSRRANVGYQYRDSDGLADGVERFVLRTSSTSAKYMVSARNRIERGQTAMPTGSALQLQDAAGITVQLQGIPAGSCSSKEFRTIRKASQIRFVAAP